MNILHDFIKIGDLYLNLRKVNYIQEYTYLNEIRLLIVYDIADQAITLNGQLAIDFKNYLTNCIPTTVNQNKP